MSLRLQVRFFGHCITKHPPFRLLKAGNQNLHGFTKKMLADIAEARDAGV